jgi:hypothetical protein
MSRATNAQRSAWAQNALQAFADETCGGQSVETLHRQDLSDCIADLMADLMHLAQSKRLRVAGIVRRAQANFEAERSGGEL